MAEIGKLEPPKMQGKYDTGQLFLHRVFGYRGVLLFPWQARVFDRDIPNKNDNLKSEENGSFNHVGREVKGRTHTYYQVLIDSRDCPYIRAQTEAVTFLGSAENSRSLYAIPGLDYVAHEDILPFSTTGSEKPAIHHELFERFCIRTVDDPPLGATDTLKHWQNKNHPWLELSDVHKETTENIRATTLLFGMTKRTLKLVSVIYWWRYCIRLENLGELTVQLRERHWRIFSLSGTLETVRGRGVVGQEPILSSGQPAFQYSSHVSFQAPSGHMWGTFRMEREDGYFFDCRIPPFSLESRQEEPNSPSGII
nr:EOG090X07J3 [Artemia franciscana]